MEPLSGLDVYSKQVACARFVAAIPEVNIAAEISGNLIDKAWCTPEQILSLGGSTTHERAILLCSLFLGLREEIQAYVLLGKSLTDGVSPLVLSDFVYESTFKQLLWCPTTGKCFPTSDPSLQHTGIGTAFDSEHIWLNQQVFSCYIMSFLFCRPTPLCSLSLVVQCSSHELALSVLFIL